MNVFGHNGMCVITTHTISSHYGAHSIMGKTGIFATSYMH